MQNKFIFTFLCTFLFSTLCHAGYQAIGPIKAEDCYNFGVKICSIKTVTEVRKDGKRFEITNYFERVSRYQSSNSMCYINIKSDGLGILSYGINALTQPEFWGTDKEGKYVKVDADFLYFKCVER
jgi:hypothetical protein